MLHAAVDAAIRAEKSDLAHARVEPGALQQQPQRHARPVRRGHAFLDPGHGGVARRELGTPVPRALQSHAQRARGERPKLFRRNGERLRHPPSQGESRRRRRDVEMDQQVMQACRRERFAQRLERHAVIARGECHFLPREATDDGRAPYGHRPRFYRGDDPIIRASWPAPGSKWR
jgi:hypothetical protein